ncbi:hypothetical protein HX017_06940 [Myroides marinus]|uniref:hypothetical protein n=1 Tax=Myroides marinus TaxID=703342 RepID=UPI002578B982|nr:hypothetical protein [Myroides marinus]MDM1346627.1 hypothetical protein [Myroides marinus]MDM1350032.1 hypothetical protein [Myroides marinus]MDM1357239.1 hypothetical protein [Myroides marinus]MDM1364683.1 hypothetical protein [Myroides marinus]
MKKITLLAALLGTTYFANAQVGIGTADPATSAELDIVAKAGDKGILIPRVTLTVENKFAPIKGAEIESLLVYNSTASTAMPKGFYYWDGAKWNRIIGKSELDTVVENLGSDITNIQNVINYILPTNPDNTDPTKPGHTTIVYDKSSGDLYEVVYDAKTKKYITNKIDLLKMIQGKETNTFFREIKDTNGKITGYVYFNESTIVKAIGTETDEAEIKKILDGLDANTPGAISIDVKGTVVNNIQEILKSKTEIKEGGKTFTTVEEYLQYISQSAEGNVIYTNLGDDTNPNWVFQYYNKADGKYVTISLRDLVAGTETKTFVKEISENGKVTGFIYFSEQTIIDWLAADKGNTVDNIPDDAKGAITVDVKGTVVNNIQEILKSKTEIKEGGKTFTTVEQYLQYISQSADGNVIYKEIDDVNNPGKKVWVFQYYDKNTRKYETINLRDLVAGTESKTTIVTYNNKQYYLSEAYIVGGGELDVTKWTDVPAGAIHVDVVGGVINNIEEILTTQGNITIQVGGEDMTFNSVEEYLQYITQFSEGNVIYTEIEDPKDASKKIWVLQYWDGSKYETINLTDLVASVETKTNILRTESKTNGTLEAYAAATAPVEANVKKGEIFYKYNNEDKGEQFINMTADIISSINNNEDVKNALTNVLNQGGNVYFGKIKDTDKDEVFYTMVVNADGTTTKTPIKLPASFILEIINKYKDVVKNALGDHINNSTTIVNTGNTYNGKMVFLAKGTTTVGKEVVIDGKTEKHPSPLTTGTTIDLSKIAGLTTIEDVLTISILKAGKVVASSVTDLVITSNKLAFAIGTGSFYTSLPYGEYEVVLEFTGNLAPMTPLVPATPVTPQP